MNNLNSYQCNGFCLQFITISIIYIYAAAISGENCVSVCCRMARSDDSVSTWTCDQVARWLQEEGFEEYVELMCSRHRLDGLSLLALTEADLRGPPLSLAVLGDIKRLTVALCRLQKQNQPQLEELGLWPPVTPPAGLPLCAVKSEWSCGAAARRGLGGDRLCNGTELRLRSSDGSGAALLCQTHSNGRCEQPLAGRLDPEVWKTVLSSIYVFLVCGFTSFVMVIVHERVPDMRTYPPLPDIFLDRYIVYLVCFAAVISKSLTAAMLSNFSSTLLCCCI